MSVVSRTNKKTNQPPHLPDLAVSRRSGRRGALLGVKVVPSTPTERRNSIDSHNLDSPLSPATRNAFNALIHSEFHAAGAAHDVVEAPPKTPIRQRVKTKLGSAALGLKSWISTRTPTTFIKPVEQPHLGPTSYLGAEGVVKPRGAEPIPESLPRGTIVTAGQLGLDKITTPKPDPRTYNDSHQIPYADRLRYSTIYENESKPDRTGNYPFYLLTHQSPDAAEPQSSGYVSAELARIEPVNKTNPRAHAVNPRPFGQ